MTSRVAMAGIIRTTRRFLELLLVLLVLLVVFTMVLGRGAALTGRTTLIVSGPSMEPTVRRGSAIVIEPIQTGSLAVGDVITIRVGPEQAVFTHRIVRLAERPDGLWLETKGDANELPDPSLVPASAVMGRVVLAIPALGYLLAALSTLAGIGLVAGLAGLLLSLLWACESLEVARPWVARPAGVTRPTPGPA
ncbi:MAG: signal peptidase [Chloroflexi bacterium]|nr:signal peptidase [Chloroflexota bacterium]